MKIPETALIFIGIFLNRICGLAQISTTDVKRPKTAVLKDFGKNSLRGMNNGRSKRQWKKAQKWLYSVSGE
jgi:hypothetical protein